jgi:hypothetical protein
MNASELKQGITVRGPVLPEPIEVPVGTPLGDPYFSLSISRVDPLPHQLEAVYDYFMRLPRIRFLLADDPGAGKTIMAGLLLKELGRVPVRLRPDRTERRGAAP